MSMVGAENLADIYPNRGMKLHFYEQQAEHTHAYKCSGNMGPARERFEKMKINELLV